MSYLAELARFTVEASSFTAAYTSKTKADPWQLDEVLAKSQENRSVFHNSPLSHQDQSHPTEGDENKLKVRMGCIVHTRNH